ncbi:ATP-binding protein [Lysobacter sp. 2RAF19]
MSLPHQPTWPRIGTVVGDASTGTYTFVLKSLEAKLGDIVATRVEVPSATRGTRVQALVWGRITSIDRFNPFFPAEAAQELANESIDLLDTVLSGSRDHLEATVLVLGATASDDASSAQLSPLTYPVKPSAEVLYPPAVAVRSLLTGEDETNTPPPAQLVVGTLIARGDVQVALRAKDIVSRHLAILAMTGGGKTVAARRIIRELIQLKYPLVIFDPHGDYLGLFEKRALFPETRIQCLYPVIRVRGGNLDVISDLIDKMGRHLSEAQQQFYLHLLNNTDHRDGETAADFILKMISHAGSISRKKIMSKSKKADKGADPGHDDAHSDISEIRTGTINAVKRSLAFVLANLRQMEQNNKRLRDKFPAYEWKEMPDPSDSPEDIVAKGLVSIFYLAGYDHLNQSAIVSLVLESLFEHRSTLSDRIPPFQAVIEEAHNFIPSRQEGASETPSLTTIRKVITEGRKFGTGLVLISQRPSRLDETTLAQCNSFLVLRLVNPKDKSFVRSVMENLSEADANILQAFGRGQGIVSGQAVRFPLLVQVNFDDDLVSNVIGDEDFIEEVNRWSPNPVRSTNKSAVDRILESTDRAAAAPQKKDRDARQKRRSRRGAIQPKID